MSIPLSKEHGINPTMAVCERCGKETGELLLLGRCNEYECQDCGAKIYGRKGRDLKCVKCGSFKMVKIRTDIAAPRSITMGICDECKKTQAEYAALVRQGGVYWRCKACGSNGVVRPGTEIALIIRHASGIVAPKPVGVGFTPKECPVCQERKEVKADA